MPALLKKLDAPGKKNPNAIEIGKIMKRNDFILLNFRIKDLNIL
tara:strand:+ start:207 stop:338 length:132 start_codon:yes stop_codon:yes gene_type:complete